MHTFLLLESKEKELPSSSPSNVDIGDDVSNAGASGPSSTSFPDDLDIHSPPPEFKEGSDWFALFNPKMKRVLDVILVHTFVHERRIFGVLEGAC